MAGKRPYHLKSTQKFILFAADITLGWRAIRHDVKFTVGEAKVAARKWRQVQDKFGTHIGYQVLVHVMPATKAKDDLRRKIPPTQLKAKDAKLIAGLFGKSKTAGLSEDRRLKRHDKYDVDKILAPEDAIERAQEKVKQWPFPASRIDKGKKNSERVFGDRAVRVYPKPA